MSGKIHGASQIGGNQIGVNGSVNTNTVNTNTVNTDPVNAGTNKRRIVIAVAVTVAIALTAIALYFAEVKFGLVSLGFVWLLTSPSIVIPVVTLLVIGAIAFAVYRYTTASSDKQTLEHEKRESLYEDITLSYATLREATRSYNALDPDSNRAEVRNKLQAKTMAKRHFADAAGNLRRVVSEDDYERIMRYFPPEPFLTPTALVLE